MSVFELRDELDALSVLVMDDNDDPTAETFYTVATRKGGFLYAGKPSGLDAALDAVITVKSVGM